MNRTTTLSTLSAALVMASYAAQATALTLTPGTILGADAQAPGGSVFTLVQYSPAGTILDTLALTNTGALGTMDGLAVVGSTVYVAGTSGGVGQVDLATGVVSNLFNASVSLEALGELNGNLLIGRYGDNLIDVRTPAGVFVQTITPSVPVGMTGVDSDGSRLYVASYDSGLVYTLDLSGNVLSSFNAGAGGSSLSGLGYDAGSNTLWVSTGFDEDDVRHFDLSGNLLGSFPAGYPFIDSLAVVPIPEPTALALTAAALAALAAPKRRRRQRNEQ